MSEYGEKLKQIRQSLRFTQDEFAFALCIKPRTYAAYERNENKPTLNMLEMLCNDYDVDLNWLISSRGEMFITAPQSTSINQDEILKVVEEFMEQRFKEKGL